MASKRPSLTHLACVLRGGHLLVRGLAIRPRFIPTQRYSWLQLRACWSKLLHEFGDHAVRNSYANSEITLPNSSVPRLAGAWVFYTSSEIMLCSPSSRLCTSPEIVLLSSSSFQLHGWVPVAEPGHGFIEDALMSQMGVTSLSLDRDSSKRPDEPKHGFT